jgi:beta-galactosidase
LTFRSGVKDENNQVVDLPLPGRLRDLAGVRVVDYTALLPAEVGDPHGGPESVDFLIDGTSHLVGADIWMDELEVNGAEVLARYRGEPFDRAPAVTIQCVGAGQVVYVGTSLDDVGQNLLMDKLLTVAKVTPGVPSPDNVEIVRRVHDGIDHWFVLNHSASPQEVTLPTGGIDLLSGKIISGPIVVNGRDALVVRSNSDAD